MEKRQDLGALPSNSTRTKGNQMECLRCGIEDFGAGISRRVNRGDEQHCAACVAQPKTRVMYQGEMCHPWTGLHDEFDNPVTASKQLFMPGVRTCGHRDCVRASHVIAMPDTLKEEPRTPKKVMWTMEGSLKIFEALEDVRG
jgi:hypothetical protein